MTGYTDFTVVDWLWLKGNHSKAVHVMLTLLYGIDFYLKLPSFVSTDKWYQFINALCFVVVLLDCAGVNFANQS